MLTGKWNHANQFFLLNFTRIKANWCNTEPVQRWHYWRVFVHIATSRLTHSNRRHRLGSRIKHLIPSAYVTVRAWHYCLTTVKSLWRFKKVLLMKLSANVILLPVAWFPNVMLLYMFTCYQAVYHRGSPLYLSNLLWLAYMERYDWDI